jgi:sugar phosphate isomerase/epimerase
MNFAFMSFTYPQGSLEDLINYAKKYGYQGIEPRAQAQHKHGVETEASDEERKKIKQTFEKSGVECACIATSLKYCFSSKEEREKNIVLTGEFTKLAKDIGCRRLRVFGGMPDTEMERKEAIEIVGQALKKVKEFAERDEIYVCLETHDFFCRADTVAAAVKIADSRYIKINWDIMHPFTQGMSMKEAFKKVKNKVEHCHIHDGTYDGPRDGSTRPKLALMGKGEIPYKEALSLLKSINYQGYLSGEYIKAWEPEVVLPHDIKILQGYL